MVDLAAGCSRRCDALDLRADADVDAGVAQRLLDLVGRELLLAARAAAGPRRA